MITNSVKVLASEVKPYDYNREDGIIGWMDCGGSNLVKIDEQLPLCVRLIATTRISHPDVNARRRAEELGDARNGEPLPLVELDLKRFERRRGVKPGDYFRALKLQEIIAKADSVKGTRNTNLRAEAHDMYKSIKGDKKPEEVIQVRDEFCQRFMERIYKRMEREGIPTDIPMFAAGGMALLSKEFVESFRILNVHPGAVIKYGLEGVLRSGRIITGDGWIPPAKAISSGHDVLYSSMHGMIHEMDAGPNFMRGYGLPIDYNYLLSKVDISKKAVLKKVGGAAQDALKHIGDHVIAGATFDDLFRGNWGVHDSGVLAYRFKGDWYLAPVGIMIEDHVKNNPKSPFKRSNEFIEEKVKEFYAEIDRISKGE